MKLVVPVGRWKVSGRNWGRGNTLSKYIKIRIKEPTTLLGGGSWRRGSECD